MLVSPAKKQKQQIPVKENQVQSSLEESAPPPEFLRLYQQFNTTSRAWTDISDMQVKMILVAGSIDSYRQQGVIIRKSPLYYAGYIDVIVQQNPDFLDNPLSNILRIIAIMDYDFDNGQNKDQMAYTLLGADSYKANKKRLGYK